MKHVKNSAGRMPLAVRICIPLLLTLLCGGILLLCAIRPYELAKTYLRIGFMDSTGTSSDGGTAGLHITETDIDTDYTGKTAAEGEALIPTYGSQCAILEAKSIDLYVPVYWGSGSELLDKGACQTPASAALGGSGNSVISAHVNTFFHELNQLKEGDIVTAYTTYGKFTYTVTQKIAFAENDESYLKTTEDDRLTLYTCEIQLLGASAQRVGVVCKLTDSAFYETQTNASDSGTASAEESTAAETGGDAQ